jgi:glycosyltransferase involved in cell wall biosynthesis
MKIESLAVIAYRYPCNLHPTWHLFVRQIAHSFARQGVEVAVLSPLSFHRAWRGRDPFRTTEDAGDGAAVTVYRPRFISMSSKRVGKWNSFALTVAGIRRAVKRVMHRELGRMPDAIYGHFLYPAGAVAVSLGREMGIPAFPAAGEISLDTVDELGTERARTDLAAATGFIANSNHLARLMSRRLGIETNRIAVFPNAVNRRVFFPRDRSAMRQKYGLPARRFLVAFVGSFEERKGPRRVAEAIRGTDRVAGVYIGDGEQPPAGAQVAFCRRVPHEDVPEILSACDVFALPTTDEGCCNAILEAMACGLPVISSNGPFNDEILNDEVSVRLEPLDVLGLRAAITCLRDTTETLCQMSRAALAWAAQFDIDQRAQRILKFMEAEICSTRPAHTYRERQARRSRAAEWSVSR